MTDAHPFHLLGIKAAVLSDDRMHRYWLFRIWDQQGDVLVACMFNPSTADDRKDDPTIKRLCAFAQLWGYGGLLVVNLHSYRSPYPDVIADLEPGQSCGDAQFEAWAHALDIASKQGSPVLVAWGALASQQDAAPFLAAAADLDLICLGLTIGGHPKHPMARGRARVPDDQQPVPFKVPR